MAPLDSRGRSAWAFAVGATVSSAGLACSPSGPDVYKADMAQAMRDEGAGRFAEAAHAYDAATGAGHRLPDRDQARWDAAEMIARSGDSMDAATRIEAIAADPTSEHQAEAAYRLATLRIEAGDADRGWRDMEQVPRRFPDHGIAHVAVRRLVQHSDEVSTEAGLDELRRLRHDLGSTELVELVDFLSAEHIETLGDDRAARGAYVHIADQWPYPFGPFFDDSLWRASLIDERLGFYENAIADLERLLRERETTSIVGSYERSKYVPAMLRVGELYRDRLHDRARARDAFHRLYANFAHSTMRDRALWLEAALWHQDGDERTTCDRLGTLVEEFPDSRYVPCALEECGGLVRPRRSRAPAECREYIERTSDGVRTSIRGPTTYGD